MTLMHDFNITDRRAFIKAHDKYEHNILFYLPTHKEHAAVSFFLLNEIYLSQQCEINFFKIFAGVFFFYIVTI